MSPAAADAFLELLLHTAGAGVALVDTELRFVRINSLLAQINHVSPANHLGRTIAEVMPHSAPVLEPLFRSVLETGAPVLDQELAGPDPAEGGRVREFVASYFPLRVHGRVEGVASVVREVTGQRRTEHALREQETLFSLLMENLGETFHVDGANGHTVYVSPAYASMFGREPETLYADPRSWLQAVHPDDRERVQAALPRAEHGPEDLEYRLLAADGTVRWVRDRIFPIAPALDGHARSAGIVEDVTAERERLEAERLLADAGRALAASLDAGATMQAALDLLVPRLGDLAMVLQPCDDGACAVAAWRHADPAQHELMEQAAREYRPTDQGDALVARALRSATTLHEELSPEHVARVLDGPAREVGLRLGAASTVAAPLVAHGRVRGALVVSMTRTSGRRHAPWEVRVVREVAERAALALENARLYEAEQHARRLAELAAERLARVQALTARLSGALSAAQVARAVLDEGLEVFGAYAGGVLMLSADGERLETIGVAGYPDELTRPFTVLPLDAHTPATEAVRTGRPTFVQGLDEQRARYPNLPLAGRTRSQAAVPLVAEGRVTGVLGLSFDHPRAFDQGERALFETVAPLCAQALERVRLYEAERAARERADAQQHAAAFLSEASRVLAHSLDYHSTLQAVARAVVPGLADWCSVDVVADAEWSEWPPVVERVVVAHQDAARVEWARELERRVPTDWNAATGMPRVIREGVAEFYPTITDEQLVASARSPEELELLREIGFSAYISVPLLARGRTLGALTLCHTESGRHFDTADLAAAESLAARAAVAVDNARLYTAEQAARAAAEAAAERTRRLQALTAALSGAATGQEVCDAVLREGMVALDADAGGVTVLTAAGAEQVLVSLAGFAPGDMERWGWARFPVDRPLPVNEAVRTRAPVCLPDMSTWRERYPGEHDPIERAGYRGVIAVPLELEERVLGAAAFHFRADRELGGEDVELARAIARQAAQALERARLLEGERASRAAAEAAADRMRRLQTVTAALSRAATPQQVAHVVVELGCSGLNAGLGFFAALDAGGSTITTLASHGYAGDQAQWRHHPLAAGVPLGQAVRTGQMALFASPEECRRRYPDAVEDATRAGCAAYVAVPVPGRAGPLGGLAFGFREPRALGQEERAFVTTLAELAAQAFERARAYDAEHSARTAAEADADRARRLHRLAAALSEAATPHDVARAVTVEGGAALGAHGGSFYTLAGDGRSVELAATLGFSHEVSEQVQRLELLPGRPFGDALLERRLVLVESVDDCAARYPAGAGVLRESGMESFAVAPLLTGDAAAGGVAFTFRAARTFGEQDRTFLLTVAGLASQALERARAFEAERHARAEAEEANRAKTGFLAVMSHELRTPLNAIAGYAELLAMGIRGPVTPAQLEDLARITRSQRHLLGLINDVLNFAKLSAGRVELTPRQVRVGDALAQVETLLAPQVMERGLSYRFTPPPPALAAQADPEKLQQVLLNVLSNAVKFTPAGGTVELWAEGGGSTVTVHVRDTGPGIPADRAESIFEPFVQLDRNLTSAHEGTGLGLAISRDLARAMNGDLTVRSEPGHGATFTLTLPRASDAPVPG